jgi:hypothetical protein
VTSTWLERISLLKTRTKGVGEFLQEFATTIEIFPPVLFLQYPRTMLVRKQARHLWTG